MDNLTSPGPETVYSNSQVLELLTHAETAHTACQCVKLIYEARHIQLVCVLKAYLMPYLAIVYATCPLNHLLVMLSGGERFKMCCLPGFFFALASK
jgi:hypothetical protein